MSDRGTCRSVSALTPVGDAASAERTARGADFVRSCRLERPAYDPRMWRGEIDGVTVLREDLPGVPAATLTFGCGARDEALDTTGLTHLV